MLNMQGVAKYCDDLNTKLCVTVGNDCMWEPYL